MLSLMRCSGKCSVKSVVVRHAWSVTYSIRNQKSVGTPCLSCDHPTPTKTNVELQTAHGLFVCSSSDFHLFAGEVGSVGEGGRSEPYAFRTHRIGKCQESIDVTPNRCLFACFVRHLCFVSRETPCRSRFRKRNPQQRATQRHRYNYIFRRRVAKIGGIQVPVVHSK